MRSLTWNTSHAVFVEEIDDEHKEIFGAISDLEKAQAAGQPAGIRKTLERLILSIDGHFAHEERLMRAARYQSLGWHKKLHDTARRRLKQQAARIQQRETEAIGKLIAYLASWLPDHAGVADRMMGAFLRNQRRTCRMMFQAGTRPAEACQWVDCRGERVDPNVKISGL